MKINTSTIITVDKTVKIPLEFKYLSISDCAVFVECIKCKNSVNIKGSK